MVLRRVANALGLLLVFRTAAAGAEPISSERPVRFAVDASPMATSLAPCGGESALIGAVEERLGRPPFVPRESSDVLLSVTAPADGRSLRVESLADDGSVLGTRDVTVAEATCDRIRDRLAMVLAVLVGPERTTTAPEPRRPGPLSPQPSDASVATEPAPAERAPRPPTRRAPETRGRVSLPPHATRTWSLAPTAEVVFGTGVLPRVAFGTQLGVEVRTPVRRFLARARVAYWPEASVGSFPSIQVDRVGGAALACLRGVERPTVVLDGCLGVDAALLRTSSDELTQADRSGTLLDALAESRLGTSVWASQTVNLESAVTLGVGWNFRRDTFRYRDLAGDTRVLLRPAMFAAYATFGVVVHFR